MGTPSPSSATDPHADFTAKHRFAPVVYQGQAWDLTHLDPFAFHAEIQPGLVVDVVVFFSCHCFTHGYEKDERLAVPREEIFLEGHVRRVLNLERWQLSRAYLPGFVSRLQAGHIRVIAGVRGHYATFQSVDQNGQPMTYAVFFDVEKDGGRKKRLLLRVRTAYPMQQLTRRLAEAKKVNLVVLLRAAYEGRRIRP